MRYSLYGKLPAQGDFVSRGLAHANVESLDLWLSAGLLSLQSAGADWLQFYLVGPVWQGVVPAGRMCDSAVACVLMPSVDRVGRYFPLLALRALAADLRLSDGAVAAGLTSELAAVATVLPAALQEGLQPDALLQRIEQAGSAPLSGLPAPDGEQMLAGFQIDGSRSQWWSVPGRAAPFRFISHRGTVDAELFASLYGPS